MLSLLPSPEERSQLFKVALNLPSSKAKVFVTYPKSLGDQNPTDASLSDITLTNDCSRAARYKPPGKSSQVLATEQTKLIRKSLF